MNTLSNNRSKAKGSTALEAIFVIGLILFLAACIVPALGLAKTRAKRINCLSILKSTGLAARMWSNDHGQKYPWQVSVATNGTLELVHGLNVSPHFRSLSNELNTPKILACSSDVQRIKAALWSEFDDKHLSYFVGLDSNETRPQSILFGDRNITGGVRITNTIYRFTSNSVASFTKDLHNNCGNIALGDGSAEQVSRRTFSNQINAALLSSGQPALRLAIP